MLRPIKKFFMKFEQIGNELFDKFKRHILTDFQKPFLFADQSASRRPRTTC